MWFELQLIWLNFWGVDLLGVSVGVSHHRNYLTMLIPDTWVGVEQYLISFMWFGLQLIWLNFGKVR